MYLLSQNGSLRARRMKEPAVTRYITQTEECGLHNDDYWEQNSEENI